MLPFRVKSSPSAHKTLTAFGPGNATLGISLPQIEPGTNQWIYDDEHVAAWLSGRPDANWVAPGQDWTMKTINKLWLYGPSGSGRTLLAATLVQELLRRQQMEARHATCYYFCSQSSQESDHQRPVLCLKTLVAQLAQQSEAAFAEFNESVVKGQVPTACKGNIDPGGPRFDENHPVQLVGLLETMSRHFDRVSLVIKSVDYLPLAIALQLASLADAPGSTIRIIFTSGDGEGQQDACMQTVSCPVDVEASTFDLQLYMRNELQRRIARGAAYLEPESSRAAIEQYILANNHGSWLWAVTVLDDQCDLLRRGLWQPPSSHSNRDSEAKEPEVAVPAFNPYLERILQDTGAMPKFILIRVAHWLAIAQNAPDFQPSASEICKALTVLFRNENEDFRTSQTEIQEQDVIQACRPIVQLTRVDGVPYFSFRHSTIYGYLVHTISSYGMPLKEISYDGYTMGREFKDIVTACNGLRESDASVAESLFQQLLISQQKLWGPDDADTLFTYEHYASLCWDQGRLKEAERMYLDIVRGYERVPPAKPEPHYNVLNSLGILYKRQERFQEAANYYQAALRGRELEFGARHESTLQTVNNIALLYAAQDKTAAAQAEWKKALPLYEETFGSRDTKTLAIVYNLGLTYKTLGEYDEAERMLSKALSEHTHVYGGDHDDTLDIVTSLAHLHILRGDDAAAEALYTRALSSLEKMYGPNSPKVLPVCHNLAKVYHGLNRMDEAETMCQRALSGYEATAGADGAETIDVAYTLFLGYIEQGRLREAVALGQRVLTGFEKSDGGREGITASVADNLALTHAKLNEFAQAEPLWQQAYEGHKAARGDQDELALAAANNLGLLYMRQQRLQEAETWLLRALQGYELLQGKRGETVMRIARHLAGVYKDMGRIEESDDMAMRGYR